MQKQLFVNKRELCMLFEMEPEIKPDISKEKEPDIPLSAHTKRVVLDYLKENGCTHANLQTTANQRRQSTKEIIDFFCRSSENAEKNVNQDELMSTSLRHINQWLELLKSGKLSTLCEYEAAAVMNAIVRNEPQPDPAELGGVNLSEVYSFMERALTGQPQKELSKASEAFLSHEIKLLIDDANSDESDNVVLRMDQNLRNRQVYNYEAEPHRCSLDPLFLEE